LPDADEGHTDEIVVSAQFQGPPNSGNGGYVCGLLAAGLVGPIKGVLRAPVAVDTPLRRTRLPLGTRLTSLAGDLIAEAGQSDAGELPAPPACPSLETARVSGLRFIGLERPFHPICFTCADALDEGFGLRVFVGQVHGADEGVVAGVWKPHLNFIDLNGLASVEAVWAALDCPGSVAWQARGGGGGLLGTMTCEILRRPALDETCIVMAWPIEASGRKRIAGTALFSGDGDLMARSRQIWIGRSV
jgi:hypothetical protein